MSSKLLCKVRHLSRNISALYSATNASMFQQASSMPMNEKAQTDKSTIDISDIKHHANHSNVWWDPNGTLKALHAFNEIRVPFIRDGLVNQALDQRTLTPLKCKKILDVGCGGGILTESLARIGAQMTGIDASQQLIQLANKHSQNNTKLADNQPNYLTTTIEEYADTNSDVFDGVVASEIIEHVNNKELFIKSCIKVLKPGGRIFFTTPNRTRLSQILGIWAAENILQMLPKGTHQYEKFITPNELTFILERNNCHVEIIYGLIYFPNNTWQIIKSKQLMYAIQAVKYL